MAKVLWILTAVLLCGSAAEVAAKGADAGTADRPPGPEIVASLRARGPDGLEQALQIYDRLIGEQQRLSVICAAIPGEQESELNRRIDAWRTAIEQIGGQRSCAVSRLYWYTDLAEAKAAAERTGRPILSLRMLGKLTDEFSCANSRYFRTTLYSNKEISEYLRNNFILHWQSVRPVPRVTIDFGDGRKLERTITGNSAHYVLASDGAPLDVLPGLYSPQQFLSWLNATRNLGASYNRVATLAGEPTSARAELLKQYHRNRRDTILRMWDRDLQRLGDDRTTLVSSRIDSAMAAARLAGQQAPNAAAPAAKIAAQRAVTKSVAELPLLRFANFGGQWMEKGMDDDLWQAVANLHRGEVQLDQSSVALMRQEFPQAAIASRLASGKRQVEDPILRLVNTFENSISLDTVRNEYLLHRRVHERLADSTSGSMDFDTLNEWVYAELFLTPSSDPWLGLAPNNVYTGVEHDGRVEPSAQPAGQRGG